MQIAEDCRCHLSIRTSHFMTTGRK